MSHYSPFVFIKSSGSTFILIFFCVRDLELSFMDKLAARPVCSHEPKGRSAPDQAIRLGLEARPIPHSSPEGIDQSAEGRKLRIVPRRAPPPCQRVRLRNLSVSRHWFLITALVGRAGLLVPLGARIHPRGLSHLVA
jgi:hypothetical protein